MRVSCLGINPTTGQWLLPWSQDHCIQKTEVEVMWETAVQSYQHPSHLYPRYHRKVEEPPRWTIHGPLPVECEHTFTEVCKPALLAGIIARSSDPPDYFSG